MPLNSIQQDFIEGAISHFFDFEASDLFSATQKLKQVFFQQLEHTDDFVLLQECINQPEERLQRLEQLNSEPITKGEVQNYILNFTTQYLKKTASKTKIDFETLEWSESKILSHLKEHKEFEKKFETKADNSGTSSSNPSELEHEEELIYQVDFDTDYRNLILTANVTVKLSATEEPIKEIHEFEIKSAADEANTIDYALEVAKESVVDIILNHLEYDESLSSAARHLITYKFYFDYLKGDKSRFKHIDQLNSQQLKSLTCLPVISLLENKICDLVRAKKITSAQRRVICNPFYFKQLLNHELEIKELSNITVEQSKNVTSPNITQLVAQNKLSFTQAKSLSTGCKLLLENEQYFDMFKKNLLDAKLIQHLQATPAVIHLITDKKTTLEDALSATKTSAQMIENNPLIYYLIAEGHLTIANVNKILFSYDPSPITTAELTKTLNKQQFRHYLQEFLLLAEEGLLFEEDLLILYHNADHFSESKDSHSTTVSLLNHLWSNCKSNILTRLEQIQDDSPRALHHDNTDDMSTLISNINKFNINSNPIWAAIFSARLAAIIQHYPHLTTQGLDDIDRVKTAIEAHCIHHTIPPYPFQNEILKNLLIRIKNDLQEYIEELSWQDNKNDLPPSEIASLTIQGKITDEIMISVRKETEEKSSFDTDIWPATFKKILACIKEELAYRNTCSFISPTNQAKTHHPSPTFFKKENYSLLKSFFERLSDVAKKFDNFEKTTSLSRQPG